MEANIEELISLDEIATHVGLSRRQLERLFQKYLHCVPTRYYMRLNVVEQPGVFAQILRVLGDRQISIASAIQKEMLDEGQNAEIVLMTHRANEAAVQGALEEIERLQVVNEIGSLIRVEEWD